MRVIKEVELKKLRIPVGVHSVSLVYYKNSDEKKIFTSIRVYKDAKKFFSIFKFDLTDLARAEIDFNEQFSQLSKHLGCLIYWGDFLPEIVKNLPEGYKIGVYVKKDTEE